MERPARLLVRGNHALARPQASCRDGFAPRLMALLESDGEALQRYARGCGGHDAKGCASAALARATTLQVPASPSPDELESIGRGVCDIVCSLNPRTIDEELGREVLLWSLLRIRGRYGHSGCAATLDYLECQGIRMETLHWAMRALDFMYPDRTGFPNRHWRDIGVLARGYELAVHIDGAVSALDTERIIRGNADSRIAKRLGRYAFGAAMSAVGRCDEAPDIAWGKDPYFVHLDAPVGILLLYDGKPNALATFFPSTYDTLTLHQLQAERAKRFCDHGMVEYLGGSPGIGGLDYKKALVQAAMAVASSDAIGFKRLEIQSGQNNRWVLKGAFNLGRALAVYDGTAGRMDGFAQNHAGNWRCDL